MELLTSKNCIQRSRGENFSEWIHQDSIQQKSNVLQKLTKETKYIVRFACYHHIFSKHTCYSKEQEKCIFNTNLWAVLFKSYIALTQTGIVLEIKSNRVYSLSMVTYYHWLSSVRRNHRQVKKTSLVLFIPLIRSTLRVKRFIALKMNKLNWLFLK